MRIVARQFWMKSTTRLPCLSIVSLRLSLLFEFLNKYLGIMDVSDLESNVHYSLDRETLKTFMRPLFGKLSTRIYRVAADLGIRGAELLIHWITGLALHKMSYKKNSWMDLINYFFILKIICKASFCSLDLVLCDLSIII